MIEQGFNNDSTIKEMTAFFETRVDNLEPNEEKKKIFNSCQEKEEVPQEEKKG